MGLDQYGIIRNKETKEETEIAYWRKHNALQGWMEDLWNKKGRPNLNEKYPYFNGVLLNLEATDLIQLGKDILSDNLPQTEGFFFGEDSRNDFYQLNKTKDFITKSLKALNKGYEVFYDSSW